MDWLMNIVGDAGNWITAGSIGLAAKMARNWLRDKMSKDTKGIVSRFLHVAKNADEVAETADVFDKWWNKRDNTTSFNDVVEELEDCRVLLKNPNRKQKQNKGE